MELQQHHIRKRGEKMFKLLDFFRVHKSLAIDLGTANILIYDKQKKKIQKNIFRKMNLCIN